MARRRNRVRNIWTTARIGDFLKIAVIYIPIVMIPIGLLTRTGAIDKQYYVSDIVFTTIVELYLVVSVIYFYLLGNEKIRTYNGYFLAVFHILTACFILFVSGFSSAFPNVWVLLMVSAALSSGLTGIVLSFVGLVMTGTLGLLLHLLPFLPANDLGVIQEVAVVGIIGYLLSYVIISAGKDKIALDRTREQETFQRERLLTLVNSMGDAVVTTDESGIIKIYNSAFLNLLDTNTSFVGKTIDEVLKLVDKSNQRASIIEDAQKTHKIFSRTDLSHRFNDDETIRLYINVAPIQPDYQSNGERGFIFIIRDITKEKTLEEERDEFIAIIGHELRTPIAIIEGNLSNVQLLLTHNAKIEVLRHALSDAHDQALYLAKLINDLSTLSRAEHGINMEGAEEIDPKELLTSLYSTHISIAQKAGLRLDLDLGPKLHKIKTSRTYIDEIMRNLVGNAIKYTREGSVTIIGRNVRGGVYIAVKDTGIGISKSDQRHIFDKFYRSEDYRTRESTGTGLGLYICKKLADLLGLELSFESRLNHGSIFGVTVGIEK